MSTQPRPTQHHGTPTSLDRVWFYTTHPLALGSMLGVAGVLLMLSTLSSLPSRLSESWWATAAAPPEAMLFAIFCVTLAAALGLGTLVHQWRTGNQEDFQIQGAPASLSQGHRNPQNLIPWVGVGLMAIGVLGCMSLWLSLQQSNPPVEVAVATGEHVEYVQGRIAGKSVRLMLPRRVKIENLSLGAKEQIVELRVTRPKQEDVPTQTLRSGESVTIDGTRLSFIGVTESTIRLRGIFKGTSDQSIEAAGQKGDTIKVSLDDPGHKVVELTSNYLGTLGPAAKLLPMAEPAQGEPEPEAFWVFYRATQNQKAAQKSPGIQMTRIETAPAALFVMAPVMPFEPLIGFAICFALGLALFVVVPDSRRLGQGRFASINDAGMLAQATWKATTSGEVLPTDTTQEEE